MESDVSKTDNVLHVCLHISFWYVAFQLMQTHRCVLSTLIANWTEE